MLVFAVPTAIAYQADLRMIRRPVLAVVSPFLSANSLAAQRAKPPALESTLQPFFNFPPKEVPLKVESHLEYV